MSAHRNPSSEASAGGRKGDAARAERLRAALRQNLKRRKVQARERSGAGVDAEAGAAHDFAGFMPDKSGR